MSTTNQFVELSKQGKIGLLEIKNRIVFPPTGTIFDADGYVTERHIDYYGERAKGGAGLVIVENTCVESRLGSGSRKNLRSQLCIDDDRFVPGLARLVECIHEHGAKAAIQISHEGRAATPLSENEQPVAPSSIAMPSQYFFGIENEGRLPRELTISEIRDIIECFASAAKRAQMAGFDGIEVQGAHAYLIAEFLSSAANRRGDNYGGSLENRARLLLEIIRRIKDTTGKDYPVWCRLNGLEYGLEGGTTIQEACTTARMAQDAGADAVSVSAYAWGATPTNPSPTTERPGSMVRLAAEIKKGIDIPVIAVGRITPEVGETALREKRADFVAIGRALVADPQLPAKVVERKLDEIRPCVLCMNCIAGSVVKGEPLVCTVNPTAGRERSYELKPVKEPRSVLVVGGGPAGMEAARVAALRGHRVRLYEKENRLGGLLHLASLPPQKSVIESLTEYMVHQVGRSGAEIRVGEEVNASLVEKLKPDIIILATGGVPIVPEITGIGQPNVIMLKEVLLGAEVGNRIVVVGGEMVGLETAEFLAEKGKKVTITTLLPGVGETMLSVFRAPLLNRLIAKGATLIAGIVYESITREGVVIVKNGKKQMLEADTIVIAAGSMPNTSLLDALTSKRRQLHCVGDCFQPRNIGAAIHEGWDVAYRI